LARPSGIETLSAIVDGIGKRWCSAAVPAFGILGLVLREVAMVVFAFSAGGSRSAAATAAEGTPGVLPTPVPVLVEVGGQKLALDAPRSLEIAGGAYQVMAGEVQQSGALKYPALRENTVVWFPSPANWLIGASAR
jgi:hypothetical protein